MTDQIWPFPGSRWWKFDFHTHTPASLCRQTQAWQQAIGTQDEVTPGKWLLRYMEAEIDCVAITDHNTGEWVDQLKAAYQQMKADSPTGFRELHLFPGVELSVQGGIHLLAVFSPESSAQVVNDLLATVRYDGTRGDSDGVTKIGLTDVLEEVTRLGGLAIPAHVDKDKGLLQLENAGSRKSWFDANTLRQVFNRSDILAIEHIDLNNLLPEVYMEVKAHWARVLGSDSHSFRGSAVPGCRYTWVKMATPSLEGLRLALMDGNGLSLRCSDLRDGFDPFGRPEHFITSIEIRNAKFMGRRQPGRIEWSPYYNALIGGRGTGKSTVVHALRLAYRREDDLNPFPDKDSPKAVFDAFRNTARGTDGAGALLNDTEILVELVRDGAKHRITWQFGAQRDSVDDWDGTGWVPSSSQAINAERFPLRLFSQGQIAAMAGANRQALLNVIDEAAGVEEGQRAFVEARQTYFSLCAQDRDFRTRLSGKEESLRRLGDVKRKLASFTQSHHSEVLKAFQSAQNQTRELDASIRQVYEITEEIDAFVEGILLQAWPEGLFDATSDADVLGWRTRLETLVQHARERILGVSEDLIADFNSIDSELSAWRERAKGATDAHEALKAALAAQGVQDPQEFDRLTQQQRQIEAELKNFEDLETERRRVATQAAEQIRKVFEIRQSISRTREVFLEQHLQANRFVRIQVKPFEADPDSLEKAFRELLNTDKFESDILERVDGRPSGGLLHSYLNHQDRVIALEELKSSLLNPSDALSGAFRNNIHRQKEQRPEFADHILCWFPEDDLEVTFSRKGDGSDFIPITQGSAGQRSAAMLAFLLSFGAEPLVLDQPEDDLDNHLIYELIVQQIRENKLRRQLVVVTHNPNIVVNGDAEMVHAFDFKGQCYVKRKGALQERTVRDEVCLVLEGGPEAFSKRWERLGREI